GTLLFGALADRFDQRWLLWVIMGTHAAGFLLMRATPGAAQLYAVLVALGIVGGGMMPVYAALIGRVFGPASFGLVMGLAGLVMVPFGFAFPPIAAALRDSTGSYGPALLLLVGFVALAGTPLGRHPLADEEPMRL